MATENLSHLLENKMDDEKRQRAAILDKSSYCELKRKVLIVLVHDGLAKNQWDLTKTYKQSTE